jgi:TetR/AcrR family transcriptional regulator, regulator of cefoperazone and chloramphenicol sensitivity
VKTDAETRARLLQTAERLFGERGFKVVTVRQICTAARANVAAVNYHFGDKLGLYREVLQGAIDAMRETSEAARRAGEGQPPEEQLRRFVGVFLQRVLTPGRASIHRIITREINDPTPALDVLVEQGVRPRVEYLSGVIARILRCDPRDKRVLRCVASVQAQAVSYFPNPISARLGFSFEPTEGNIEDAARHIATFSLAGVKAVGRPARSRPARAARPRPIRAVREAPR